VTRVTQHGEQFDAALEQNREDFPALVVGEVRVLGNPDVQKALVELPELLGLPR